MKFINILGSNGTGKSTRVLCLVKYLDEKFEKELVYYESSKLKKEVEIGRIYQTSIGKVFILGRFNKSGKWVGLDTADLSTYESRYKFIEYMRTTYNVDYYIQEGYFNNRGYAFSLEKLHENGAMADESIEFFFLYRNIQDFIERTNGRTGKDRGLEWAEKAPGWRDNLTHCRVIDEMKEQAEKGETKTKIIELEIDAPKDYFVTYLFGENYDCNTEKQPETKVNDWL